MFYVTYHSNLGFISQIHIYSSLLEFNKDWIPKFKQYCTNNNTDATTLGAKCEIVPLGEDEVTLEPLEVKDFSCWTIKAFTSEELRLFISKTL